MEKTALNEDREHVVQKYKRRSLSSENAEGEENVVNILPSSVLFLAGDSNLR